MVDEATPPLPVGPRAYRSTRYGFLVTLPPGWRESSKPGPAGAPTIEQLVSPDGTLAVGIWSEPCSARALPAVPASERAAALPLANGFVVPFVGYTPASPDRPHFLEGRWLQQGRRWTVHAQMAPPYDDRLPALRPLVASLRVDG